MELVENNTAGGELDHPDSAVVSLANVSHRVTEMWWKGEDLYGKVLIAEETPAGKILKGLLVSGFMLGISSRGVGSVQTKGDQDVVQDDFELICWDFVTTPSTNNAWVATDQETLTPYMEGIEPSEYEKSLTQPKKPKDFLNYFSDKKRKSVDDALTRFMSKF